MNRVKYITLGKRIVLTERFTNRFVDIPAGEDFDGYTIPKWLHWFHRPMEGELTPSVVHDWMLRLGDPGAHNAFRDSLKEFGFKQPKRQLMYWAVRLYGMAS